MLMACLESLAAQAIPADISMAIIVVDNEYQPNNRAIVEAFAPSSPFPVHYVHQPKRGIAAARNAILDKALSLGTDWIAMLDDDEVADPDWIAAHLAPEYRDVEVLSGLVIMVYPEPHAFWTPDDIPLLPEGAPLTTSTTTNVRFSAELARAGLRFDEGFGLNGGEDRDFFGRAYAMGFAIRSSCRPVTRETVHPSRVTYWGQMHRAFWSGAAMQRRDIMDKGRLQSARENAPELAKDLFNGTWRLLVAALVSPSGQRNFKRQALRGGRNLARALGRASALVGHDPQPYRHIVGY